MNVLFKKVFSGLTLASSLFFMQALGTSNKVFSMENIDNVGKTDVVSKVTGEPATVEQIEEIKKHLKKEISEYYEKHSIDWIIENVGKDSEDVERYVSELGESCPKIKFSDYLDKLYEYYKLAKNDKSEEKHWDCKVMASYVDKYLTEKNIKHAYLHYFTIRNGKNIMHDVIIYSSKEKDGDIWRVCDMVAAKDNMFLQKIFTGEINEELKIKMANMESWKNVVNNEKYLKRSKEQWDKMTDIWLSMPLTVYTSQELGMNNRPEAFVIDTNSDTEVKVGNYPNIFENQLSIWLEKNYKQYFYDKFLIKNFARNELEKLLSNKKDYLFYLIPLSLVFKNLARLNYIKDLHNSNNDGSTSYIISLCKKDILDLCKKYNLNEPKEGFGQLDSYNNQDLYYVPGFAVTE